MKLSQIKSLRKVTNTGLLLSASSTQSGISSFSTRMCYSPLLKCPSFERFGSISCAKRKRFIVLALLMSSN